MESIISLLASPEAWHEYYLHKTERGRLPRRDAEALLRFIESEGYLPLAKKIASEGFCFQPPEKRLVSKLGSDKKRVVYSFPETESLLLKLMTHLLYRYDGAHSPHCYSFRQNTGARRAVLGLAATPGIAGMFCCKLDISDYFNSISVPLLLPMLKETMANDPALYAFLQSMLTADEAMLAGARIEEKRGAMAGTPPSPFLANLYLRSLDGRFEELGLPYARYSDDIIFFSPDEGALLAARGEALRIISGLGLKINEKKAYIKAPGEAWEFLGVEYLEGEISLSRATMDKLKGKLRRKARALYRWRLRKNAPAERAIRACIRAYNRKFFEDGGANDLTWARWFFPLITNATGLREIDAYAQQCLRYIASGKHGKKNFDFTYEMLKRCGYRSLVHEYYSYLEGR